MQAQPIPILILAQSGRFLAQSATQAGYTVWVADCYGDTDLLAVVERWQSLPHFTELTHDNLLSTITELTQGEECLLICGSGIERYYHLLLPLPANIRLIGNTPNTIHSIKTPALFFELLEQYAFGYPKTQFASPSNDLKWLKKHTTGLGGSHIQYASLKTANTNAESYYQYFISGSSGSCLFLANGHYAHLISINQQYLAPEAKQPFRLGRIESAWQLSAHYLNYLDQAANQLTAATHLVGLNSLDFIISDNNELLILEINPRVSASAELIANKMTLFQQHMNACLGQLPTDPSPLNQVSTSLFYHYAAADFNVPENMIWPTQCHDLPAAGLSIKKGAPICISVVTPDENNTAGQLHNIIEQKILNQLILIT